MSIKNYISSNIKKNKILANFIVLFTGDGISSILNIFSTAIIIQAIGMNKNGMIIMIQTYALFFDQIFNFKVFESLIKFLTKSIYDKDKEKCKFYIKQGVVLDLITAIIATIMGILMINIVINVMGWEVTLKPYIIIYMVTVIFNISGVCIGIIRTYNKFNYISYINVIVNIIKIIMYTIGLALGIKFNYFFCVEIIISILKNILLIICAYRIILSENLGDFYKGSLKFEKDFLWFSINTNLASTIDLPINTLTTFIMNKYLGFEAISVYKVFEKIGSLVGKFSSPLNQIIYPELNIYVAKGEKNKAIKLTKKLGVGISIIGILVLAMIALSHSMWLEMIIPNYDPYILSLYIYILYIVFTNSTAAVHSLFLALGYVKYVVPILLSINTIYLLIIIPIIKILHLNGVILMLIIQALLVVAAKIIVIKTNDNSILHAIDN